jgi:DNA processing protein
MPNNAYLALWLCPDVNSKTLSALLAEKVDLTEVCEQPQLFKSYLSAKAISHLRQANQQQVEQHLAWQQAAPDHHIITLADPHYPAALREITDPPAVLMLQGDPQLLNDPQLAIVGSRRMSSYGKNNAFQFAKHLAEIGLVITSGMAFGIDSMAHQGALAAHHGKTIAVFGTSIDQVYPSQNRALAEKIREHGALISELPLGTSTQAFHFPRRNRIVTGMSLGLLVVEAAVASGSLISARLAMEQGREVFTIPGSIHNVNSKGCHQLLRQGAKLVESSQDILLELKPWLENTLNLPNSMTDLQASAQHDNDEALDADYQKLLACIEETPTPVDLIIAKSQFKAQEVSSMLLMLELQGYIESVTGGYIKLKETGVLE